MSLIKSISGIRGTIGGPAGDGLSPIDIVKFTAAFAKFIATSTTKTSRTIVVGRDARLSGAMVDRLVTGTLMGMGFDVVDIDLASTPTTELAVVWENACGGLILTASHNPRQWNALKLLNEHGEFLSDKEGKAVLRLAEELDFDFATVDELGKVYVNTTYNRRHIDAVMALPLVDTEAIRNAHFTVAVDAVNSVGGIIIPQLLKALGVEKLSSSTAPPPATSPIPPNLSLKISPALPTLWPPAWLMWLSWLTPMLTALPLSTRTARCSARNIHLCR